MTKTTKAPPRMLSRRWKGIPVRDADADLLIFVSGNDVRDATPGDPANCAASLACKRLYESTGVEFFHSVAYVDLPDPAAKDPTQRVVLRFALDNKTARMIEELDGGGSPSPGGYRLRKPAPSHELNERRRVQQEYSLRVREARIRGEIYEPQHPTNPESKRPHTSLTPGMTGYVRSGTGRVSMKRSDTPTQ